MKAGTETTNTINLATALHREAVAVELQESPGWISRTFKAIEEYPYRMNLWKDWESIYCNISEAKHTQQADEFYRANKEAMDEGAAVLWEEQEPLYALMKMRLESGYSAFEREKQNSPVNPALCEFPESYFDNVIISKAAINRRRTAEGAVSVLALDPSRGTESRCGDYAAYVLVTKMNDGLYYVDAWLDRKPISAMIRQGIDLYNKYKPPVFCVEVNQFQVLLQDEFERSGVPVFPLQNMLNKKIRIRRLEPLLAQRKLRFADTPGCRLLLEQLRSFPAGDRDDGPDALEMAVRVADDLREE
jgi:predicted phage terminase large subunit-like protein